MILFASGRPADAESFDAYREGGGYAAVRRGISGREILEAVTASGLTGRGGAGFPVARKWAVALETAADRRYVVCNAGEDEPGSFKDRLLLEHRPHLVLDGTVLAARALAAAETILYINETYRAAIDRMHQAIAEAEGAGCIDGIRVRIAQAPPVYVAGEDTACLEVLEGRPAKPRPKPPYPAVAGLFGCPTVVNNVETLANIPAIVNRGPEWFRQYGTPETPGTMIFCVGPEVKRPGAYELPVGSSIRTLLEIAGGLEDGRSVRAVQPGGPSSAFLTGDRLDLRLDPNTLRVAGSSLGCGVVRFIPEGTCMVEEVLSIAQFFARESCGQCPACRMETGMVASALERVRQGSGDAAILDQFQKVIDFNRGKGYCALIDMPGPPILSALSAFRSDFEHHLEHGSCPRSS